MNLFVVPDFNWIIDEAFFPALCILWCLTAYSISKQYISREFNTYGLISGKLSIPIKKDMNLIRLKLIFYSLVASFIPAKSFKEGHFVDQLIIVFVFTSAFMLIAVSKHFKDADEKNFIYKLDR